MEVTLGLMIYSTFGNNYMDITYHLRLIKVLIQDLNCFFDAKMSF